MGTKQFKAESKRLLDLMINSIYTNKEIFLRELISNASDAIDKLYYRSLTDKKLKINKEDLKIRIDLDKDARILTITDNGCGMTEEELDKNLGTIAKSGSLEFKKEENEKKKEAAASWDGNRRAAVLYDFNIIYICKSFPNFQGIPFVLIVVPVLNVGTV